MCYVVVRNQGVLGMKQDQMQYKQGQLHNLVITLFHCAARLQFLFKDF